MKIEVKIVLYILGIIIIGLLTGNYLISKLNNEFFEKLILPIIFATFSLGFIGFNIIEVSKFKILVVDFMVSSLLVGTSGLLGLLYIVYPQDNVMKVIIGGISLILFISGFIYYLIIIAYSIYIIEK